MQKKITPPLSTFLYIALAFLFGAVQTSKAQISFSWAKNTQLSTAEPKSAVRNASGDLYITGNFTSTTDFDPSSATASLSSVNNSPDAFLAKYDSTGNYSWAIQMGGDLPAYGEEVDVDAAGNVYVFGYFQDTVDFDPSSATNELGANGSFDVYLAKYDPAGNYLWAIKMGGPIVDFGYSMDIDPSGNALITGYFINNADFDPSSSTATLTAAGGSPDAFLAKYDSSGAYLWAKNMGGPAFDQGNAVTTDANGSVYVTGYFNATADFDPSSATASLTSTTGSQDGFIAKYDSSGNYQWAHKLGGGSPDEGTMVTTDQFGYVYAGGVFQGTASFDPTGTAPSLTSAGDDDLYLTRFDTAGNFSWAHRAGASLEDQIFEARVDTGGTVWYTGAFKDSVQFDPNGNAPKVGSAGGSDIFLAGLDSSGAYVHAAGMGSFGDDQGTALLLDENNDFYLAGTITQNADLDPSADTALFGNAGVDMFFAKYARCQPQQSAVQDTFCGGSTYSFGTQTLESAGTYSEIFSGANGCDSIVTLKLAKGYTPDTTVNPIDNVTLSAVTVATGYQWLDCDSNLAPISGANQQIFTATKNGHYAVVVTGPSGCSDTSSCHEIKSVGLKEAEDASIEVYPNPSESGLLKCSIPQSGKLKVYNSQGKAVLTKYMNKGEQKIDLSAQPSGVYYLRWQGEKSTHSIPIVINH